MSPRHLSWLACCAALVLLLTRGVVSVRAEGPGLSSEWKLTLLNPSDVVRSGGPILLRFEINNPRSHPVEIAIRNNVELYGQAVISHRTNPIVLAPGRQIVSDLIPPLYGHFEAGAIYIHLTLDAEGHAYPQGTVTRVGASPGNLVVGHILDRLEPKDPSIFKGVGPRPTPASETPAPPSPGSNLSPTRVTSADEVNLRYHTWLEPEQVPVAPLALGSYDVLVIHPAALAELRPRQMEAIAQWVDAGGLLVAWLSSGQVPADFRWDALQPIFARRAHQDADDWAKDPALLPGLINQHPLHFHLGAGLVSLFGDVNSLSPEALRRFFGFARRETGAASFNYYALDISRLSNELLKRTPNPLSPLAVFWWMIAFAVLAGAGDYFFLGWFRRRKYTWILFPILAAGASLGMFAFANHRMTSLVQRAILRIVDIGVDGRVLREYHFTAVLPAHAREDQLDGTGALVRELSLGQSSSLAYRINQTYSQTGTIAFGCQPTATTDPYNRPWTHWPVVLNTTEGQPGSGSTLRLSLQQWTPRIFRALSFGGADDSGIPWDRYVPSGRNLVPESEGDINPVSSEDRRLLDPAGRYEFHTRAVVSSLGEEPHSLLPALAALSCSPEIPLVFPVGADLAPFNAGMVDGERAILLLALRRDGANLTCYRKLQRLPLPHR